MPSFVVGQTSSIKIHAAMANEMLIEGLNSMTPPIGASSGTVTIEEFGVPIDKIVPTSITYDLASSSGNFMLKSASMAYLRNAQINQTEINDIRWYFDLCSFVAADLINDSSGHVRVASVPAPTGSKSGVYSGGVDFAPVGLFALFENHRGGVDIDFVADAGSGASVTDASSLFVTNGFVAGQICYADNVDGLDPLILQIASVAPGEIFFEQGVGDEASVTTASGVATTMLSSADPIAFDSTATTCA